MDKKHVSGEHPGRGLSGPYHVRCTRCGRLFDVDMDYIRDLEASIKNTHGFQFTGHELTFRGICPACGARDAEADGKQ